MKYNFKIILIFLLFNKFLKTTFSVQIISTEVNLQLNEPTVKKEEIEKNVKFYLYTILNPGTPQQIFINVPKVLNKTYFSSKKKTKFLIHGWRADYTTLTVRPIKHAYLATGDYNIIMVDWKELAYKIYLASRALILDVGKQTGEMINYLMNTTNLNPDDVHILGHSLGAHIAGIAARSCSQKIARVTGLDPAAPFVDPIKHNDCLKKTDAKFVDVIHTDGGQLGMVMPLGQVDFYPNGGRQQPGCFIYDLLILGVCSHMRAPYYYSETILNKECMMAIFCKSLEEFTNGKCDTNNIIPMGEDCPTNATGTYFFQTRDLAPFGMGKVNQKYIKNLD